MPIAAAIPAIIGVASAGATIYSASQSAKANKKGLAAQQTAADRAAGLQEQQYADLAPWRSYGLGALQQLAQVNGISIPQSTFAGTGTGQSEGGNQYLQANPDVAAEYAAGRTGFSSPGEYASWHYQNMGQREGRAWPSATPTTPATAAGTPPANNQTAASADPRLAGFYASPDYAFRVAEGTSAISNNAASRGLLDSGATGKALVNYGQQQGSAEFSNWYNRLAQAAGVGQAATNQSGQALTNQGNIIQNQAQNQATSYQNQAQNNSGLVGNLVGIGNGLLQSYGVGAAKAGGSLPGYSTPSPFSVAGSGAFSQPQGSGLMSLYGSVI